MKTREQVIAVVEVMKAMLDVVKAGGDQGVPAGMMYAACMGVMSLDTFESMMDILIEAKRVKRVGHIYYITEEKANANLSDRN